MTKGKEQDNKQLPLFREKITIVISLCDVPVCLRYLQMDGGMFASNFGTQCKKKRHENATRNRCMLFFFLKTCVISMFSTRLLPLLTRLKSGNQYRAQCWCLFDKTSNTLALGVMVIAHSPKQFWGCASSQRTQTAGKCDQRKIFWSLPAIRAYKTWTVLA